MSAACVVEAPATVSVPIAGSEKRSSVRRYGEVIKRAKISLD